MNRSQGFIVGVAIGTVIAAPGIYLYEKEGNAPEDMTTLAANFSSAFQAKIDEGLGGPYVDGSVVSGVSCEQNGASYASCFITIGTPKGYVVQAQAQFIADSGKWRFVSIART